MITCRREIQDFMRDDLGHGDEKSGARSSCFKYESSIQRLGIDLRFSITLQVLKMMVGNNLKDTQLQQIVDKTILFADKDEDGKISFEEFCNVVGNTDIHKKMVVDV